MAWLDTPNANLPQADNQTAAWTPRQCLEELIEPAHVDTWLDTPNAAFGGKTPRVIAEERPELLEQMIWQFAGGSYV